MHNTWEDSMSTADANITNTENYNQVNNNKQLATTILATYTIQSASSSDTLKNREEV